MITLIRVVRFFPFNYLKILVLFRCFIQGEELEVNGSRWVDINAPDNFIPVFVRGGFIIPTQEPANNTMFR